MSHGVASEGRGCCSAIILLCPCAAGRSPPACCSCATALGTDGDGHMCDGWQLVKLARECGRAGLVLANVHSKNMMLVAADAAAAQGMAACREGPRPSGALRFIDVGSDWWPASEEDTDRQALRCCIKQSRRAKARVCMPCLPSSLPACPMILLGPTTRHGSNDMPAAHVAIAAAGITINTTALLPLRL